MPETKSTRLAAIKAVPAKAPEPKYWLFERRGAAPLVGVGNAGDAENYLRKLNHNRLIDPMTLRPLTSEEATAIEAGVLNVALHGDRSTFIIAAELRHLHGFPRHT
jgi:hypothetical protein